MGNRKEWQVLGSTESRLYGSADDSLPDTLAAGLAGVDDVALCAVVRADADSVRGRAAFAELYGRHREAVIAQAYTMTRDWGRAEDLTAETFARVLRALAGGNGPQESVLGYILVALRGEASRAAELAAESVPVAPETIGEFLDVAPDFVAELSERDQIVRAFVTLPSETRQILWAVDVEGLTSTDAAEHLGTTAGALRVSVHRARKRLATSYLQQYVEVSDPTCLPFAQRLASLARQSLGTRESAEVSAHLAGCAACTAQLARLRSLAQQLRVWVGPLLIGGSVGGITTAAGSGSAPAAMAASAEAGPPHAAPAAGGGPASAAPAQTAQRFAVWASLAAGVGLVIWGMFLMIPQAPEAFPEDPGVQEPAAHEPAARERPSAPAPSTAPDGDGVGTTDRTGPAPTDSPRTGGAAVEGDDDTPNWFLQE